MFAKKYQFHLPTEKELVGGIKAGNKGNRPKSR
jgi:hypothetical protein